MGRWLSVTRFASMVLVGLMAVGFSPLPVAAASASSGYVSTDTHGCAPGLTLFVPNHLTTSLTSSLTGSLNGPLTGLPGNLLGAVGHQLGGVLKTSGKSTINWLTKADCGSIPVKDHTSPKLSSPTPASPPQKEIDSDNSQTQAVDSSAFSSQNWSGYWQRVSGATEVSQSWKVPGLNTQNNLNQQVDSTIWPGIGGSGLLVQAGTVTHGYCTAPNACTISDLSFWYEAIPDLPTIQTITNLPIRVGDQVSATVGYNYEQRLMSWILCNNTLATCINGNYQVHSAVDPENRVEFVVERAMNTANHSLSELNNFGDLNISNMGYRTEDGSGDLSDATPIIMTTCSGERMAEPGPLSSDGTSFTDHWLSYGQVDSDPC